MPPKNSAPICQVATRNPKNTIKDQPDRDRNPIHHDPIEPGVALLPEDPNVQEWFERSRPAFSSAIVFVDQYWDRYVDSDFDLLRLYPPKLIIMGRFIETWGEFGLNRKTVRLMKRVRDELLPRMYQRLTAHEIIYQGRKQHMDVYIRRERY